MWGWGGVGGPAGAEHRVGAAGQPGTKTSDWPVFIRRVVGSRQLHGAAQQGSTHLGVNSVQQLLQLLLLHGRQAGAAQQLRQHLHQWGGKAHSHSLQWGIQAAAEWPLPATGPGLPHTRITNASRPVGSRGNGRRDAECCGRQHAQPGRHHSRRCAATPPRPARRACSTATGGSGCCRSQASSSACISPSRKAK